MTHVPIGPDTPTGLVPGIDQVPGMVTREGIPETTIEVPGTTIRIPGMVIEGLRTGVAPKIRETKLNIGRAAGGIKMIVGRAVDGMTKDSVVEEVKTEVGETRTEVGGTRTEVGGTKIGAAKENPTTTGITTEIRHEDGTLEIPPEIEDTTLGDRQETVATAEKTGSLTATPNIRIGTDIRNREEKNTDTTGEKMGHVTTVEKMGHVTTPQPPPTTISSYHSNPAPLTTVLSRS